MQHHPQQLSPFNIQSSLPTMNITTEQIQKYLDENKGLILSIMENQNLGKLAECAQYQDQLQKNLMYLAAIADAQPQAVPAQVSPQPTIQPGQVVQHPRSAMPQQLPAGFGSQLPFHINTSQPHNQQQSQHLMHFQQQQPMAGPTSMRIGANGSVHPAMNPAFGLTSSFVDARGRQDVSDAGSVDGR